MLLRTLPRVFVLSLPALVLGWSAPVAAGAAAQPPSLSAQAAASTVESGKSVAVSGRAENVGSVSKVVLERAEATTWTKAKTGSLAPNTKAYAIAVVPTLGDNQYRAVVVLTGGEMLRSEPVVITGVLKLSMPRPAPGQPFSVTGVLPSKVVRPVLVERRDGDTWVTAASSKSSTSGSVTVSMSLTAPTEVRLHAPAVGGFEEFASPATSVAVTVAQLTGSPQPTITGSAIVGSKLTASTGSWAPSPVALSRQWQRDGADIPGATGTSYIPTADDVGARLSLAVTGSKPGYATVTKVSNPTAKVATRAFSTAATPWISGTPKTGFTLTANTGTWKPAPEFGFEWRRGGVPIPEAYGPTYRLTGDDIGSSVSVAVTGLLAGHTPTTKVSQGTGKVTFGSATPTASKTGPYGAGVQGDGWRQSTIVKTDDSQCRAAAQDPRGVIIVGDSITTQAVTSLPKALATAGHTACVNAAQGRPAFGAIDVLEQYRDSMGLPPTVVMAAVSGDIYDPPAFQPQIRRLMQLAGPERRVIWINVYMDRIIKSPEIREGERRNSLWLNSMLADALPTYPNLSLIDWWSRIRAASSPGELLVDGAHPTAKGTEVRNAMIVAAVGD